MKKTIRISGVACLTIFATIFTACNKSEVVKAPTSITTSNSKIDVSVSKNGYLAFPSRDVFDNSLMALKEKSSENFLHGQKV